MDYTARGAREAAHRQTSDMQEEVCLPVLSEICLWKKAWFTHRSATFLLFWRLTDVVVLVSRAEFEAQREGREELELLGEAQGAVGALWPVALPALEASHAVLAGGVAVMVHHEEDVALHPTVRLRGVVVWAVDVQVVVDTDRHGVLPMPKPERRGGERERKRGTTAVLVSALEVNQVD